VRNDPSRSSKVVDFGVNQKRICDFLLIVNSNLGLILLRFRDIVGFPPKFSGVPFGPDWRSDDVVALRCKDTKVINRVINFKLIQPICSAYINVTDRQTDGRTDDLNGYITTTIKHETCNMQRCNMQQKYITSTIKLKRSCGLSCAA